MFKNNLKTKKRTKVGNRKAGSRNNSLPLPRDGTVIQAVGLRARIGRFPGLGIPDRLHVRLIYGESFALTASNLVEYHYKGNGIYDPRAASGGGQPHYFDQFMALYQQFYVSKSQSQLQVVNRSYDTYGVALFASSENTGLSDYYEAEEQQNKCVNTMIAPSQGDVKRLVLEETTRNMLALPATDATTWGTNSADPTNLWYHRVLVQNLTQTMATSGFFTLKMIFDVEFFDRREIGPSMQKFEAPKSAHRPKLI